MNNVTSGTCYCYLKGATYPIELLLDAERLAEEAAKCRRPSDPETKTAEERPFARGAIFTALNFVESVGLDLTCQCLEAGEVDPEVQEQFVNKLKKGSPGVGKMIQEWPKLLGKEEVLESPEFIAFKELRELRNKLVHPNPQATERVHS